MNRDYIRTVRQQYLEYSRKHLSGFVVAGAIFIGMLISYIHDLEHSRKRLLGYVVFGAISICMVISYIHALVVSSQSPLCLESAKGSAMEAAKLWGEPAIVTKTTGLFGYVRYDVINLHSLANEDERPQIFWEVEADGYAPKHIAFYYDDKPVYIDEKEARVRFPYDAPPRPDPSPTPESTITPNIGAVSPTPSPETSPSPPVDLKRIVWVSDAGDIMLILDESSSTAAAKGEYINTTVVNGQRTTKKGVIIFGEDQGGSDEPTFSFGDNDDLKLGKPMHTGKLVPQNGGGLRWISSEHTACMPADCTFHSQ